MHTTFLASPCSNNQDAPTGALLHHHPQSASVPLEKRGSTAAAILPEMASSAEITEPLLLPVESEITEQKVRSIRAPCSCQCRCVQVSTRFFTSVQFVMTG
eukprot:scpid108783/ scgid1517/ 